MTRLTSIWPRWWRVHILLLIMLLPLQAQAWEVAAVRDKQGVLAFCRAELLNAQTGLTLAIALSPQQEINVGIKVPDGDFTKGETFSMTLALDGAWRKEVVAEAGLPDLLLVRLGVLPAFLDNLGKAVQLRLISAADETRFDLKGSGKAIAQLQECVKNAGEPPSEVDSKEDFPAGLAALLQAAGLKITPVPLPNVPDRAVDYAWVSTVNDSVVEGGFREQAPVSEGLAALVKKHMAGYEKQCGVKNVTVGKVEKLAILSLQQARVTCGREFAAFVFYRTDSKIFTQIILRGAQAPTLAARDSIAAVVKRLGNEKE